MSGYSEPRWEPPAPPPARDSTISALLVARVYAMVLEDASSVGIIAVGTLVSALVFAGIAVPAWLLGGLNLVTDGPNLGAWLLYAVAAWASSFVTILFSGAVVVATASRLDGHPMTTRAALGAAWRRRTQLCAWAFVTTLVSVLAEQLNRFGLFGAFLRLAADLAWAVATMLVLPVIMLEGAMPIEAITRSAALVKGRLGLTVRTKVRMHVPWLIAQFLACLVTVAGAFAFVHYRTQTPEWAAMGALLAVSGAVAIIGIVCVQSSANALLNTLLYRHALGESIRGVDPRDLPRLAVGPGADQGPA